MPNYALTLVRGPAWAEVRGGIRDQEQWPEHAQFMDDLVSDGLLLLGGPVGDGRQTLHVIEAPDESTVRERVARDPWIRAGLLEIGSLLPWSLWLDFRAAGG